MSKDSIGTRHVLRDRDGHGEEVIIVGSPVKDEKLIGKDGKEVKVKIVGTNK